MKRIRILGLFGLLAGLALPVQAQKIGGAWAWKPLFEHEGVAFSYIFYQQADSRNNGVVIKLVNTNDYAVDYRFKVVFRSEAGQVVEPVAGSLAAGEVKTGDAAGLFWVPFKDGREIAEVGLRGYKVTPRDGEEDSAGATIRRVPSVD